MVMVLRLLLFIFGWAILLLVPGAGLSYVGWRFLGPRLTARRQRRLEAQRDERRKLLQRWQEAGKHVDKP